MKYFIILLLGILLMQCRQRHNKTLPDTLPRDSTITRQNAYSELFLDSAGMEAFLREEVENDSTKIYIRNFYNSRNYSFAWFNKDGLTVQAEGFWNLYDQYIKNTNDSAVYYRNLHQAMNRLMYEDSLYETPADVLANTELRLTRHFLYYVKAVYGPKANPEVMRWHIPKRKLNARVLLDSFISLQKQEWKPLSERFYQLRNAVIKYRRIQEKGGWMIIAPPTEKIRKGNRNKLIPALKKRLSAIDAYSPSDTTDLYNDSLLTAIKMLQQQFGLPPSNHIDAALIKELNVPVEERLKQMLINLERMKWMPPQPENCITVNIPEYRLRVYENGNEVLGMNVVVGKTANRTVIFSDELEFIVFSPYWNIPRSIIRREIYPAMNRSTSYLQRNNMEVIGYYSDSLPIVRQRPGWGNALGDVKFIFPNSYNIYFHDTPAKALFGRHKRAFSHGCIRLQQPFELAKYLLRNNPDWPEKAIRKAMNSGTEKWVRISRPLPVFITYFTSWADDRGMVYFTEDIYGHDKKLEEHLFE
ncbi:L,D-transpeptidase family protein [Niastella populi]|uniref:L,D-TPase catalytic domain-containing protein n=1 Tax=Niastella populi TaxID=550983 RepID=A0A1V9EVT4_9BACT|nr:L,D-transpeptidase family protein [Niastella populi]OQP50239.1 hypothetical protein A4R26_29880 [Niastella populi]